MLTLEQVSAVNDGLRKADLKAALKPLEDAVDLRANELPRLDTKARAALKEGLKNRDNAAIWADAILHSNVSVRRFARKVLMGLGDEAVPIFEPLRANIERFWRESAPLPYSEKAREAALRREQVETIGSALELLLRADPEQFMGFYAELADVAPFAEDEVSSWNTPEFLAWQERNAAAWEATTAEVERLIEAEWGREFSQGEKRGKLPGRVVGELNERARQAPDVAAIWENVGENPLEDDWQESGLTWNPIAEVRATWNGYLSDYKPTGPVKRVNERLWPLVWEWLEAAFDESRAMSEREKMVRRVSTEWGVYLDKERTETRLPALLLRAQETLRPAIIAWIESGLPSYGRRALTGEERLANLWFLLFGLLANEVQSRLRYPPERAQEQESPFDLEILRALSADLPDDLPANNHHQWALSQFREGLEFIARAQEAAPDEPPVVEDFEGEMPTYRFTMNVTDALSRAQIEQCIGALGGEHLLFVDEIDVIEARDDAKQRAMLEQVEIVEAEIIALDEDERVERLVMAPHPREAGRTVSRMVYWNLWARELNYEGVSALKERLWPRVQERLWERLEAQLEAYRRTDVEAIEPDVAAKLTAREAKEWRAQTRREKRDGLESDVMDIESFLVQNAGGLARLKSIALADRPSCRGIRDRLEDALAAELDVYPGGYSYALFPMGYSGFDVGSFGGGYSVSAEVFESEAALEGAWQNWNLDARWDEVTERVEARLGRLKADDWQRVNLQRALATGYYRRGDFAKFEHYATQPGAFPQGVALAAAALDDFAAWRVLIGVVDRWQDAPLQQFWQAQKTDETRRARAVEAVAQTLATTNSENAARTLLSWVKPLEPVAFAPYSSQVEDALESALVGVKKWAMSVLGASDAFDRERAAQTASEMLWSENIGLAKDAAKFLSVLATQDEGAAEVAWDGLCDASALENIGLCEAVFRALVKVKSKRKSLELSEAAREKLELLQRAQGERFAKFGAKLE